MKRFALFVVVLSIVAVTDREVRGQTNTRPQVEGRVVCVPYDPASLVILDTGNGHWDLRRGDGAIFKNFVDRGDAEAGLAVAKENNQLCYIGKSNTRPDRKEYIMEFWQKK